MSFSGRARGWALARASFWLLGLVVLCVILFAAWRTIDVVDGGEVEKATGQTNGLETLVQEMLELELAELRLQVEATDSSGGGDASVEKASTVLFEKIEALKGRVEELRLHQEAEHRFFQASSQAATQALGSMSGTIEALSILFTLVLFGVTLITGLHTKELREEWYRVLEETRDARTSIGSEAEAARSELANARKVSESALKGADSAVRAISQKTQEAEENIQGIAKEWNKELAQLRNDRDAVLGFVTSFTNTVPQAFRAVLTEFVVGSPFPTAAIERIERKIQVFGAQMKIIHPDLAMRRVGIDELGASGTLDAAVILRRFLEDSEAKGQEALQFQRALKQNEEILMAVQGR